MAQIGFTHKTEPIYDRFNALRRAYEDANGGGRVYNPDFLTVLMDAYLMYKEIHDLQEMDRQVEYEASLREYEAAVIEESLSRNLLNNLEIEEIKSNENQFVIESTKHKAMYIQRVLAGSKKPVLTTDQNKALRFNSEYDAVCFLDSNFMEIKKWLIVNLSEPVSFRAYIADAEANDPSLQKVVIKQSDGAQYLEKMLAHNHNAYLTPHKNEAMVFDSRDQAKAFLRKCGRDVADWILEPVN